MTATKRLSDLSPRERADRAKAMAPKMRQTWVEGVMMRAMLAIANDARGLRRAFNGEIEAAGFRLVYAALLARVSLCLTSLWDRPRENRASLPAVVGLINDPEVLRLLRRDAFEWLPPEKGRLRQKNALAAGRAIIRANSSYCAPQFDQNYQEQLSRAKRLRDEHFAHALVGLPLMQGPCYRSFESIERVSGPIVHDIYFALTGEWNINEHEAEANQNAQAFWSTAQLGMEFVRRERESC